MTTILTTFESDYHHERFSDESLIIKIHKDIVINYESKDRDLFLSEVKQSISNGSIIIDDRIDNNYHDLSIIIDLILTVIQGYKQFNVFGQSFTIDNLEEDEMDDEDLEYDFDEIMSDLYKKQMN